MFHSAQPTTLDGILLMRPGVLNFPNPLPVNKQETLGARIQMRCRGYPVVYSNPDMMYLYVQAWAISHEYEWKTLYNSMMYEYDLLTNIDVTDTYTREVKNVGGKNVVTDGKTVDGGSRHQENNEDASADGKNERTDDLSEVTKGGGTVGTHEHIEGNSQSNSQDNYKGWNVTGKSDTYGNNGSGSGSTTTDGTETRDTTDTRTNTGKTTTVTNDNKKAKLITDETTGNTRKDDILQNEDHNDLTLESYTLNRKGDGSVRSAPEVIAQERAIAYISMEDYISRQFFETFCVGVY